jgi:multidrug efflux pump subunit AcrA (membrane-fusion protein)
MKKSMILCVTALTVMSCGWKSQKNDDTEQTPVTDVSVTVVYYGHIDKKINLTATTAFLKKNIVTAPNASFVTACYVQPGTRVRRGQALYRLESKERAALGSTMMGKTMGVVLVKAEAAGVVTEVQQQAGGYVTEGTSLCTIADTGSMVFEVDVPTEDMRYARPGASCTIELPDGRTATAVLQSPLATMDVNAQVQQVPARARMPFLPEGLRAKAVLTTGHARAEAQILPKAAIQSDDNMTTFWIMKVSEQGRAVKVPVTIGNSNSREVEITSPQLSLTDRIITAGSYQLQDGDRVKIAK